MPRDTDHLHAVAASLEPGTVAAVVVFENLWVLPRLPRRTLTFYAVPVEQGWEVILEPEVSTWILDLPDDTYDRVEAAIDMLAQSGPGLGRPLVDSITGSRHQNMKELRVGTCRILFAFDPTRNAILLVAGDKRGQWRTWYPPAIALADQRFDEWLRHLKGGTP